VTAEACIGCVLGFGVDSSTAAVDQLAGTT